MSVPKPLWTTFLRFLAPLMLSNALQSLFGTVSNVYLGQMIGVDALAAVSVFFPVMFFLFAFVMGLSTGATVLIGQAFGAGEHGRIRSVVGTTLAIGLLLSISVALIGGLFSRQLMMALATPADILDQASAYARIMLLTMPLGFIFLLMTAMIRGVGDALTPLLALALSTAIGLILTPMLIRGSFGLPAAGITSPAWAAAISNALTLIALALNLLRKKHALAPDAALLGHLRLNRAMLGKILGIGLPSAIGMVVMAIAELVLLGLVNRFGSEATAGLWRRQPGDGLHAVHGDVDFDRGLDPGRAGRRQRRQGPARRHRADRARFQPRFDRWARGADLSRAARNPRHLHHRCRRARSGKRPARYRPVELGAVWPRHSVLRCHAGGRRRVDANAALDLRDPRDRAAGRGDPEPHNRPFGRVGRLSHRVLRHVRLADGLLPHGLAASGRSDGWSDFQSIMLIIKRWTRRARCVTMWVSQIKKVRSRRRF
ncbi:Ni/Co efflux regulator RcnB [Bradyrhizobium ottawaense]